MSPTLLSQIQHLQKHLAQVELQNDRLRSALREIMKGEGRFSRLPLEHASNTIEDMKELARKALDETSE